MHCPASCVNLTIVDTTASEDSDVKASNTSVPTIYIDKIQPQFDNHNMDSSENHTSSADDHTNLKDICTNSGNTDLRLPMEANASINSSVSIPTVDAQMECKEMFSLNPQQTTSRHATLSIHPLPMPER